MINKKDTIELLNSEGPILKAKKVNGNEFILADQFGRLVAILDESQIQGFVHKSEVIKDIRGKEWIYSSYPGSMKPDLKMLDEFIGINTEGKKF